MDLTRRGFLGMVGLGGVALTVPIPLKVVAAKMADLERPPIHVGTTEIRPGDGFTMYGLALSVDRRTTCKDVQSFNENWLFTMTFRDREGKLDRTNFFNMPVGVALFTTLDLAFFDHMETAQCIERQDLHLRTSYHSSAEGQFFEMPMGYRFNSGQIIEAWLVPVSPSTGEAKPRPPLRPMPETVLMLNGIHERGGQGRRAGRGRGSKEGTFFQSFYSKFSKVRLERTRAIELGLVEPEEEEETWRHLATR